MQHIPTTQGAPQGAVPSSPPPPYLEGPPLPPAPAPRTVRFIDPDDLPDRYAMICEGDCMEPLISDGSNLHFSKSEPYASGDFVGIWLKPEVVPAGSWQCLVKRLVLMWPGILLPYRPGPMSNVMPGLIVESVNPLTRYTVPFDHLLAVHRCLGPMPTPKPFVERGEAISLALKARWTDPAYRSRVLASRAKAWANPETRARMSAAMKKNWTDPAYRERQKTTRAAISRAKGIEVPWWVPDHLHVEFKKVAGMQGEEAAATHVRRLKHGGRSAKAVRS